MATCFPCLAPYGEGPFRGRGTVFGKRFGRWAARHWDGRFLAEPGFVMMLLWAIQQTDLHNNTASLCVQPSDGFLTAVRQAYTLLGRIMGGDVTRATLRGEVIGMTMRIGQPTLWVSFGARNARTGSFTRVFDGFDQEFDDLVQCFPEDNYGDPTLPATEAAESFHRTCSAFITHILGWETRNQGLFGKTIAYIGVVEQKLWNGLALKMLVWIDEPGRPPLDGLHGTAILARTPVSIIPATVQRREANIDSPRPDATIKRCLGRDIDVRFFRKVPQMQPTDAEFVRHLFYAHPPEDLNCERAITEAAQANKRSTDDYTNVGDAMLRILHEQQMGNALANHLIMGHTDRYCSHGFVDVDTGSLLTALETCLNGYVTTISVSTAP